jgi:RNA polymerase sigma-70 factor (subfamily 1)
MVPKDDSTQTDRMLLRIQNGDRSALDEILGMHRSYLRRLIDLHLETHLLARVDPSDVVQETQLEVSRRIEDYLDRRPMSFRLWLRRTAMDNLARLRRHHATAQKRAITREIRLPDRSSRMLALHLQEERPSQVLGKQERTQLVQQAIDGLHDIDREILLLRHVEELTSAEVVELLDIDSSAASKRYGRALRRLREKLKELGVSND